MAARDSCDPRALTTPSINRLLRPLRIRCLALAKLPTPTGSSTTTYASSHRPDASKHDPLQIFPPPDKLASQIHFSKENRGCLELARRIYATRDAFKNIVVKADLSTNTDPSRRVISLAALCALTIGQNLQDWECPGNVGDPEQPLLGAADPSYADEMYEAVPLAYRGWLLVSHALGIILDTCPHHPTLICILLDVALMYRLENESAQLLEALFFLAMRPKPNAKALICNTTQSKFLVDYMDKWMAAGLSLRTYMATLITVLSLTDDANTWNAKSLDTLARRLRHAHVQSLVWLATHLAEFLTEQEADEKNLGLTLSRWTDGVTSHLLTGQPLDETVADCIDIFQNSRTNHRALSDSLTCLALQILLLSSDKSLSVWLSETPPHPSTYSSLVKIILTPSLKQCRAKFDAYQSTFRKHHLLFHEASFWACTLKYIENLETDPTSREDPAEITNLREQVMALVEEAERNLPQTAATIIDFDDLLKHNTPSIRRQAPSRVRRRKARAYECDRDELNIATPARRNYDDWVWEDDMGCWVRQKTANNDSAVPGSAVKPKISATPRMRAIQTYTASHRPPAIPFNLFGDGVVVPTASARPKNAIGAKRPRRSSGSGTPPSVASLKGFTSLVANAASQRTVLHRGPRASLSKPMPPPHPRAPAAIKSKPSFRGGEAAGDVSDSDPFDDHERSDDTLELLSEDTLPSSDVLDLFAIP